MSKGRGAGIRLRAWRLWRDAVSVVAVVAVLAVLALFAWMTREPDAEFFDRLVDSPSIGPWIDRWREPWLREAAAEKSRRGSVDPAAPARPPAETIFLGGGVSLRAEPRPEAPIRGRTRVIRHATVLERRGSWVHVAIRIDSGSILGWVDLDAPRERIPPFGEAAVPPRPMAERAPDPEHLSRALSLLGHSGSGTLGPYPLHHDLPEDAASRELLDHLDRAAERAEVSYRRRYGLNPVGEPAAEIVLFSRRSDYLRFQNQSAPLRGLDSGGYLEAGLIALWVGERSPPEVELTLLHEIAHLLERRALGPALPPWLGEGLAEEFSELGFALQGGESRVSRLAEFRVETKDGYEMSGPLASLAQLLRAGGVGRLLPLEDLVARDWDGFVRDPDVALRYAESGWFLHWLLAPDAEADSGESVSRRADGLRRFLATVALGEPPSGESLRRELDADWSALDLEFRAWLAAEGARAGI